MGTTLPALRVINRSPGPVPKIRSGTTRESEQVMNRDSGACGVGQQMKLAPPAGKTSAKKPLVPLRSTAPSHLRPPCSIQPPVSPACHIAKSSRVIALCPGSEPQPFSSDLPSTEYT